MEDRRHAALIELRAILHQLREPGRWVDPVALVRVREALRAEGITIDLDASAVVGSPVVLVTPEAEPAPCFATLTPREREVAALVAAGLRNKDIALALGLSLGTVKDHVHHVLAKSGLDSRAHVAAVWRRG